MAIELPTLVLTAVVSAATAIVSVFMTYSLTRRREHAADWRKMKVDHYREYLLALSGVVRGRDVGPVEQDRYADAVNSLSLVGSIAVLEALRLFLEENSYRNADRSDTRQEALLQSVIRLMRADIEPAGDTAAQAFAFRLLAPPPRS